MAMKRNERDERTLPDTTSSQDETPGETREYGLLDETSGRDEKRDGER